MPLFIAATSHSDVTQLLLAARCNLNIDFQRKRGETALHAPQRTGHTVKDTMLQASPEKIKKQQEDADRAMRELLKEDEKEKAASAADSQKKSKKRAGGQGAASA
jgi:hypothetical protein